MAYKRFGIRVFIRVLLLFVVVCCEAYIIFHSNWPVTSVLGLALVVLMTADLIRYVTKTNRDLANFLQSIKHHDFTASFSSAQRGRSFEELKDAFNDIIREFRRLEAEKESHHHYLQTVIEHIGVALICFEAGGEVILMNKAAKDLLSKPYIKRIGALENVDEDLIKVIGNLRSGERELIKLLVQGELHQVAIQATEFKLMETSYKLLSLQDIRPELDNKEVEAWQKLIRVLTHEIMNSITPVSTLSGALGNLLQDADGNAKASTDVSEEDMEDIRTGLDTIESRTRGLLKFVRAYRSLLKVPKPVFREIVLQETLVRISTLLKSDLAARGIDIELKCPREALVIQADPELVEQVLINLIKNAMEALKGTPGGRIEVIAARPREHKTIVQVRDNGPGIEEEFRDQIFVPFFTTKAEGSGIGLSLSRQIMQMHRGSITMQTEIGEGTAFTLEF